MENAAGGFSQKGTYNYMAPEVARGDAYGAAVDIYSLGMVLYWLMNRKRMPFLDTKNQLIAPNALEDANQKRLSGEPLPPPCNASGKMAQVILTACDPDPRKRFATARAMKKALMSVECKEESKAESTVESSSHENGNSGQTVQEERNKRMPVPGVITTFGRGKRSDKPVVIAALLVLLLSLIGGGSFIALRNRGNKDSKGTDAVAAVEEKVSVEDTAEEQDAMEPGTDTEGTENEAVTGLRFNYENINGGVCITGCTGEIPNGNLVIPSQLSGYNVLSIGNSAFRENESIKTVSFPDTTTAIGSEAFENCSSLSAVELPAGLEYLGYDAFRNTAVSSITIPSKLATCEYGSAFPDCSNLEEVIFADGMERIPSNVLYGVETVKTVRIPNSVTYIGSGALNCNGLKTINYTGSASEWDKITIEYGNDGLSGAEFNYDA